MLLTSPNQYHAFDRKVRNRCHLLLECHFFLVNNKINALLLKKNGTFALVATAVRFTSNLNFPGANEYLETGNHHSNLISRSSHVFMHFLN